ncbi:MAG: 6-phosphogluconolactonase [Desulfatibacillum sp.]|nr:6-phosphogluconolactonase [Desulfatibacillum sp.]
MITRETSPGKTVLVFDTPEDLAVHAARSFADYAAQCIRKQGSFFAALSGGKTPAKFFRELAKLGEEFEWEKIHLFQVDERMAPADHQDSNQAMIRESFVEPAGFPPEHFLPVPVQMDDAALAAQAYENSINMVLESVPSRPKRLDMILLGIGQDGHTASLFPEDPEFRQASSWVRSARSEHHAHQRVTLSLSFVSAASKVFFLITGQDKADMVRQILLETSPSLPASLVWKNAQQAVMALDRAAARAYLQIMA